MGPSSWRNRLSLFTLNSLPSAILICGLLLGAHPGFAQANAAAPAADSGDLQGSTSPSSKADEQTTNFPAVGNISGTVLDATGVALPGAEVKLTGRPGMPVTMVKTAENGWFSFGEIAPGPFELDIELTGFKTKTVIGTLPPSEGYLVPAIALDLAPVVTEVSVRLTTEQIATEQIKEQEQQRIIAVIPNFYTSYVHDAVSLTTKQKFALAWRYSIDPANIVIAAMIAGGEQADDAFAGYGQGAAGYARRFGAAYGDAFIGTFVSSAILPSILKQDPRYFYKGTGTVKSRILYAISRSVITKGDNGGWQPDYSGIGGALVSGAISNLYYPEGSQHGFDTVLTNTLIGIGTSAGVNILQEFVFPKLTPKFPKNVPGLPKHDKPSS